MKKLILISIVTLLLSMMVVAGEHTVVVQPIMKSSLEWQKGDHEKISWVDAVAYCENLTLNGKSDWRLPELDELLGLVDYLTFDPAIDSSRFPTTHSTAYWTATVASPNPTYAWGVGFFYGHVDFFNKDNYYNVRCVRTEK